MRLSSSLDQRTRAAYTKTQETQILSGENVYAWVDEAKSDGAVEYIQAWQLTADGSGNFSAAQKTYPISGNPINVYAVHGNFSTAPSGSFPTAALSHHVNVVQNTSAGYAASDLLYATGTNLARQTAAHQLTFRHLLSKIEVYLVAGIGTTKHSSSSGFDSGWGGTASMRSRIIVAGGGAYTSYDGPTLYAPYTYVKKGGCAGGLVGYDGRVQRCMIQNKAIYMISPQVSEPIMVKSEMILRTAVEIMYVHSWPSRINLQRFCFLTVFEPILAVAQRICCVRCQHLPEVSQKYFI